MMLERELLTAIKKTSPTCLGKLAALGVKHEMLFGPQGVDFAVAEIDTSDELFEFSPSGNNALILAEKTGAGDYIDLIAFHTSSPNKWWRRLGTAAFLGEQNVHRAIGCGEMLHLHTSPLEWMRNDCQGAVVLNDNDAARLLSGITDICASSIHHGQEIESILSRPTPRIHVPMREAA